MGISHFLYKLKNRWDYHTATKELQKNIATINRDAPLIQPLGRNYYLPEVSIEIPAGAVDEIFGRYDLLVNNMRNLEGQYVWEGDRLMFLFKELKFQITSCSELFIIDEIYNHHCYNFDLPGAQSCNVIDIGMNVGLASLFFASKHSVNEVYAFEPFPQSFDQAKSNFKDNYFLAHKIRPFNFGLGRGERLSAAFYYPSASGTSGASEKHNGVNHKEESIVIKDAFETISSIIRSCPEVPFVMKIDCEGAEYEIMQSFFERSIPDAIRVILMEWHGSIPDRFMNNFLEAGFRVVTTRSKKDLGLMYAFR